MTLGTLSAPMPNEKRQYLSEEELDELENRLDEGFETSLLPSDELYNARWALCVAGENAHRNLAAQNTAEWLGSNFREAQSRIIARLDRYKYELKFSLDLCERKLHQGQTNGISLVDEWSYNAAFKLLSEASDNFLYAVNTFTSVRSGTTKFYKLPDGAVAVERPAFQTEYRVLEVLVGADREFQGLNPLSALMLVLAGPKVIVPDRDFVYEWAPEIWDIVRRARISRNRVKYQFITRLGRALIDSVISDCSLVPQQWNFPWGSREISHQFFQALQVRCLYHFFSVHFGSSRASLTDGGYNQICLALKRTALLRDIAAITELVPSDVQQMLEALTLGNGVRSPDPALQPLIPVGPEEIALPAFIILSSNWERNLLSLHARTSPSTFDRNSHIFESEMVSRLDAEASRYFSVRKNFWIRSSGRSEEIDVLLVDRQSLSILICELRWILQPGDAREVVSKSQVCRDKVKQVQRKLEFAQHEINVLLKVLGVETGAKWTVNAVVIIQGWAEHLLLSPTKFQLYRWKYSSSCVRSFPTWIASMRSSAVRSGFLARVKTSITLSKSGRPGASNSQLTNCASAEGPS